MKRILGLTALVLAAGVGGGIADNAFHTAKIASATSLGVVMQCNNAYSNAAGTAVTQQCTQSPTDTSGLTNVVLTFSAATQRYPLNATGTVTLP